MNSKQKSSDRQDILLAAMQRKAPANAPVPPKPNPEPPPFTEAVQQSSGQQLFRQKNPSLKNRRVGSPAQFWFHEEDRKLLRELAAWIAGQGVRPTDSLVIRAAIRTAKTGGEFLQAYRRASELDGRLKRHNTPMTTKSNETT